MKIVAIAGSYRKNGIIDHAIDAVLDAARKQSPEIEIKKIYLADEVIEFCTNCRTCTNDSPQKRRGKCVQNDGMSGILDAIDGADCLVLGSPINFSTVTALMKKFVERCIAYTYWPWNTVVPKHRIKGKEKTKKALVITASSCPAFLGRWLMPNAVGVMKQAAQLLGARAVKSIYFGMVCQTKDRSLTSGQIAEVRSPGAWLINK